MLRRILIADDHPLCVTALAAAARAVDPAIAVESVASIVEAERLLRRQAFDLVLLDLRLRDSEGLGNLTRALAAAPQTPVIVVSSSDGTATIDRARSLGARGFLSKAGDVSVMKQALAAVLEGADWFPDLEAERRPLGPSDVLADRLTVAQTRVAHELVLGHSNKVIAYNLGLSEPTVKSHLAAIYRTLGSTNRSQAILALQAQSS